jgi:hypothetical protein
MPTLIEIANRLAGSFVQARNKKRAVNHIVIEINCLRYAYSKKPIEYSVKAALINVIKYKLPTQSPDASLFFKMEPLILEKLDTNNDLKKIKSKINFLLSFIKAPRNSGINL